MIIGVDHGYYAMKTKNFCFPSGLIQYEHEPYTNQDVLVIDGKYYVCGNTHMAEMKNICGKIPLELHTKVRQEIEERQISTQEFIQAGQMMRWCLWMFACLGIQQWININKVLNVIRDVTKGLKNRK